MLEDPGLQPLKRERPNQKHFLCLEVLLGRFKSPLSGAFLANHTQLFLPPPTASFIPLTELTATHSARSERIIDQIHFQLLLWLLRSAHHSYVSVI